MKLSITTSFLLLAYEANANDKTLALSSSFKKQSEGISTTKTEIKYLDDIIEKASPSDFNDMEMLLKQLSFVPSHKDPTTGVQLFKVTKVEKNSIYDKAGLKIGDLVANGASPKNK